MLSSCQYFEPDPSYLSFDDNGKIPIIMTEIGTTQSQEYVETGKASSALKLKAECYGSYSVISKDSLEITNVAYQRACNDVQVFEYM